MIQSIFNFDNINFNGGNISCDGGSILLLSFLKKYNLLSSLDDIDASIYLGPVKYRNVNKMKTVLINTDNRCNLY